MPVAIFSLLLIKLIPLYVTVILGVIAGRKLHVHRESIAKIVFYMLVPFIMFSGVMKAEFTLATLMLPFITYALSAAITLLFYWLGKRLWSDAHANIIACTAGTGNTGYFGLPVAIALFDEPTVAIYILLMLGVTLVESSLGYFLAARGHATLREALIKTARLPTLYAFIFGVALRALDIPLPAVAWDFLANIRGAYTVLGMMIVGLGIAGMHRLVIDGKFIAVTYAAKFIVWPLVALAFGALDDAFLGMYGANVHNALMLLAIVPMAANTVVIATLLNIVPEKAATAVLLSTLLALVYVPLMAALFIHP